VWRDRKRDYAHAVVGWLTLRFGWFEVVRRPCAVAADIGAVLCARGWTGLLRSCPNCAEVRPHSPGPTFPQELTASRARATFIHRLPDERKVGTATSSAIWRV